MSLCDACGKERQESAPVSAIMIWAPALARPFVLLPDEAHRYTLCLHLTCRSVSRFVDRAIAGNAALRDKATDWHGALVLFDDGVGAKVSGLPGMLA